MAYSARIDELEKKFTENARRYFAPLANEYRKAGDLERAIEICRAHLPQQPGHMSGHIVYGQALYESRQLDEAKTVFEAALALDPENLIALRHLGDIARDSSDPATARAWYLRVLDADPRNDEVAAMLAELDSQAAAVAVPEVPVAEAGGWGDINPERPTAAVATSEDAPAADETVEPAGVAAGTPESGEDTDAPDSDASVADIAEAGLEPMPGDGPAAEVISRRGATGPAKSPTADATRAPDRPPAAPSLDSVLDEAFATEPGEGQGQAGQEPLSTAAFASQDAAEGVIAPAGQGAEASPAAARRPSVALDERALAEVDALFDELAPPDKAAQEPDRPAGDVTGDSMFGDDAGAAESGSNAPASTVLGLETREFVPPAREGVGAKSGRDTGSMAVSGLTSFEQPTEEDSSTRAAFVTETMAELYLQQGFTAEALDIYRQLLQQNPGDANLRGRIEQLEGGGRTSVGALSAQVIEAAQQRHAARPVRTVRSFFGRLAGHHIPTRDESDGDSQAPTEAVDTWSPLPDDVEDDGQHATPGAPHISLVSDLFGDRNVSEADEAAASMLASAFSPSFGGGNREDTASPPSRAVSTASPTPTGSTGGRPAHAAGRELSLDQVFRESEGRAQRKSGGYSFEQFFSDGSQGSDPARRQPSEQPDAQAAEEPEGDLEQFTAWLEGLKRK